VFTARYELGLQIKQSELTVKPQTPVNHPQESTQHSEHGESLKLSVFTYVFYMNKVCSVYSFTQSITQ
jgi:hypothetical protein